MPKIWRQFLFRRSLQQHFLFAIFLGLILRLLSAWFVYGPQALDDYKHGVWPAYQFFAGLPLDLPSYRSHLLIWLLAGFTEVASWFGVESALGQVRSMYAGLGVLSLLGIYGTYLFAQGLAVGSRHRIYAPFLLYTVALYPLMPFLSTRAFGESVATTFVLLGYGGLYRNNKNTSGFWGFLFLGVGGLFRFHVGLLFAATVFIYVWQKNKSRVLLGLAVGGLVLLAQAGIDWLSGKTFFATVIDYLAANEGGAAKYGSSPWYNTWALFFALGFAPFSFLLYRAVPGLWRRHWVLVVPVLFFVTIHSLVPHKEERFLYPVVGLELWLLAYLWVGSSLRYWVRRVFAPTVVALSLLLGFICCFVNTQEGEIEPPAYLQSRYGSVAYLDHESLFGQSRFQFYFLRPPSQLISVDKEGFNASRVDEVLKSYPEIRAVALLTSVPEVRDQLRALEGAETFSSKCLSRRSSGSLIDRLLYSLNPKHNQRRRPTWFLVCERVNHE